MTRNQKNAWFAVSQLLALLAFLPAAQEAPPVEFPHEFVPVDVILGHLIEGPFKEPTGVFFDPQASELYVADSKNGLIGIFDTEGIPLFTFGGSTLLDDPRAVAVDAEGTIFVLDGNRRELKAFSYRGEPFESLVFRYPTANEDESGIARVATFAIGDDGRFYVADQDLPQVLVYAWDGVLLYTIRPEPGGASFQNISGLAVSPDGLLVVLDFNATPVQIFNSSGGFVRGFGKRDIAKEDFTAPIAAAFDEEGFLYIVDLLRHEVKIFDTEGRFFGQFGGWFSPSSRGRGPGEMLYPSGIALGLEGHVYVAERFGRRVQMFKRVARESSSTRPKLRIPDVRRNRFR